MTRFVMFLNKNREATRIAKQLQAKSRAKRGDRRKAFDGSKERSEHHSIYYQKIIYMNQPVLLTELNHAVKDEDVIELHAHGLPWIIGGTQASADDYTPYKLADFFNNTFSLKKDINVTIEIRSCNSGTVATGNVGDYEICFAKDFSQALSFYQFNNVSVKGYTGYIQSENFFKQSIVEHGASSRAKYAHCRLEDGEVVFKNGYLEQPPNKVIVSSYSYLDDLEDGGLDIQQYVNDRKRFEARSFDKACSSSSFSSSSSTDPVTEADIPVISSVTLCFMFDRDLKISEIPDPLLCKEGIPSEIECRNSLR